MNHTQTVLDKTDKTILQLLQKDASLSTAQIAEQVNLSQPPCWRRIKRLNDIGVINKQVALLNRKAVELNVIIYAGVKLTANGRMAVKEFEEKIQTFPEVTECYVMMGTPDFLLRIVCKDVADYEKFFKQHLALLPGVQDIDSSVALSEVKYTTELPL